MARLLVYPALIAFAAWGALALLMFRGELPPWATWTLVHLAPAAAYLAWAIVVCAVLAWKRWRPRYSLRSLMLFVALACSCEALYIFREPWVSERTLMRSKRMVTSVSFLPDGKRVITAVEYDGARIWDLSSGKELASLEGCIESGCANPSSPDGARIITVCVGEAARVWDSSSGKELLVLKLKGQQQCVIFASFSPDGRRIVTANGDCTASVWDSASGKELVMLRGHTLEVLSASFSPDGTRIVTASYDQTARVWDSSSGEELAVFKDHKDTLFTASFSPDGKRVVTASLDSTARIWDSLSGDRPAVLTHPSAVLCACFSPDGKRIVTASRDGIARVWDSSSGKELAVLKGQEPYVRSASLWSDSLVWSASFSPDGRRIVTASSEVNEFPGEFPVVTASSASIWRRYRPEWWWGIFYMLEFWFAAGFAAGLVWSLLADRRTFARMDAEAARAKSRRPE